MWYIEGMERGLWPTWKNDLKYMAYIVLFVVCIMLLRELYIHFFPGKEVVFDSGWRHEVDLFLAHIWNALF